MAASLQPPTHTTSPEYGNVASSIFLAFFLSWEKPILMQAWIYQLNFTCMGHNHIQKSYHCAIIMIHWCFVQITSFSLPNLELLSLHPLKAIFKLFGHHCTNINTSTLNHIAGFLINNGRNKILILLANAIHHPPGAAVACLLVPISWLIVVATAAACQPLLSSATVDRFWHQQGR